MVHPHTANLISISRIPASLLLLAIYKPDSKIHIAIAVGISVFAISTDLLDGWIARKYKIESELGYILDGLGDRAFHVSVYLLFLTTGLIDIFLTWLLILREICQYAVRLTELDWHETQSFWDRSIARSYTIVVNGLLLLVLGTQLVFPSAGSTQYELVAKLLLFFVAVISFSRILPRLRHAWLRALDG